MKTSSNPLQAGNSRQAELGNGPETHGKKTDQQPSEKQLEKQLKNIGPVSARWLEAIDIHNRQDLQAIGAVEAYCRIRLAGFPATMHLLYALQGAITDIHWNQLAAPTKQALKAELAQRTQTYTVE